MTLELKHAIERVQELLDDFSHEKETGSIEILVVDGVPKKCRITQNKDFDKSLLRK